MEKTNAQVGDAGMGGLEQTVAHVLDIADLPHRGLSHRFEGVHFGDTEVSFFLVDAPPGRGAKLHVHPYPEVFVTLEGEATFTAGDDTIEVTSDQVVVVPAGMPHKFVNTGTGRLRQIDIHVSSRIIQTDLEE
jgi:mannose-6-phosphate isomerase-like protein (cupin superfamily)